MPTRDIPKRTDEMHFVNRIFWDNTTVQRTKLEGICWTMEESKKSGYEDADEDPESQFRHHNQTPPIEEKVQKKKVDYYL